MWRKLKVLLRPQSGIGADNASNRDAWVRTALAALPAGARLLDIGAGTQPYRGFCSHLRYVAQDFCGYDGKGNQVGMQTGEFDYDGIDLVCDICAIPEPDGAFDAVLCTEVIEHVPDPLGALREMSRLLRPGRRLILTAPFCSATHFAPYHFQSGFSRYFYEHHLPRCRLQLVTLSANGDYFSYLAQELRRLPLMSGTYCGRRLGVTGHFALILLLCTLAALHRTDRNSHDFLCFGYHVVAIKEAAT
jgi:ubiquinone/menaquinone biosynthesis C-methylase UbiE